MLVPARSYWIKNVVLPSVVALVALFGAIAIFLGRAADRESNRNIQYVGQTAKMLLREPLLLGDHLEMTKRITNLGKLFDCQIKALGANGETLAIYPPNASEFGSLALREDIASDSGQAAAVLLIQPLSKLNVDLSSLLFTIAGVATVISLFGLFAFKVTRAFVSDLTLLANSIGEKRVGNARFTLKETDDAFRRLHDQTRELIEYERKQSLLEMTKQVAHDIRSPLAALEIVAGDVSQLPEDKRILIRAAVGRIRDIANSLLSKQFEPPSAPAELSLPSATSPQLLSSLLDPVVSEKRLQFRSNSRVEIELRLDASSYGLFSILEPSEFKRLVSNIVNNAVEAHGEGAGVVIVGLSARDRMAVVSVTDKGIGISPDILAKVGRRGETYGKAGGSGLGLYHARTSAESWGGRLEIASEIGKGTTVSVVLPQAPPPRWFVSELTAISGKSVVVLDDDASIHQVWQGRLDSLRARDNAVEIVHVSTPAEIRHWVKENPKKANEALYLMDHELLGFTETGLSLAEELRIGRQVILVTSRYEEPGVLAGCRKLGARLVPKGLAGLVPIRIDDPDATSAPQRKRWDAVLIDDDPLARMTWKMAAEKSGKTFRAFSTAADFLKESKEIDLNTPIYVDAELGNDEKGDILSLKVHELGFGEIYIATGHAPAKFMALTHLRGVVGKTPPWSNEG